MTKLVNEFIRVPVSCHIQYPVIFSYCPFTKVVQCQSILGYIWGKKLFSFQVFISEICSLNVFIPIKFCYFPEFCTTRNCSPCTTAVLKIGGEIFCQSWPLLTPFFNFCIVHWMMCEWAVREGRGWLPPILDFSFSVSWIFLSITWNSVPSSVHLVGVGMLLWGRWPQPPISQLVSAWPGMRAPHHPPSRYRMRRKGKWRGKGWEDLSPPCQGWGVASISSPSSPFPSRVSFTGSPIISRPTRFFLSLSW